MTTRERLETALVNFVERASGKNATPGEVAALPEIARLLAEMLCKESTEKEFAPEPADRPCSEAEYVNFYGSDCKKSTSSLRR